MSLTDIYFKAPVWLQNAACASVSVLNYRERYGGSFPDIMAEYRERRGWSADRLADYRDRRLRKMVDHCYRTVPYYTRLFNELGVAPSRIKTIDDLRLLPVLSKDDVRVCPDDFLSNDYGGEEADPSSYERNDRQFLSVRYGSIGLSRAMGGGLAILGGLGHRVRKDPRYVWHAPHCGTQSDKTSVLAIEGRSGRDLL